MMKTLRTIFIATLTAFLAYSCQESVTDPKLDDAQVVKPVISNPAANRVLVFTPKDANDTIQFRFSEASFPLAVAKTYVVQAAVAGTDFARHVDLGSSTSNLITVTYGDFNKAIQPLLGEPASFEAKDFEVRIAAKLSDYSPSYASEVVKVNITPYDNSEVAFTLWCPGSYQVAGGYPTGDWSPATAPKVYSPNNDGVYQGYINFEGNGIQFKFTGQADWAPDNWGNGGIEALSGKLTKGADNIKLPAAGYYQVNADVNQLTYSLVKTEWGIIGDATPAGWDNSTAMTYDKTAKVWTWTGKLSADKSMKFRANNGWDINYGGTQNDNDPANYPSGTCKAGGGNIKITADGTYTVTLDLSKQPYKYKIEAK